MSITTKSGRSKYEPTQHLTPSFKKVRAAITNGCTHLPHTDGRSVWSRRLRDLIAASVSDLGGPDNISHHEMILVRRASMICLQLELQEQSTKRAKWPARSGFMATSKHRRRSRGGVTLSRPHVWRGGGPRPQERH